jgi:hypothetical protein
MHEIFQIKRVLDRMDKFGPKFPRLDDVVKAAASDLLKFVIDPAVQKAKSYALYEMRCFRDNRKALPLAQWYYKRGNLK